MTRIFSRSNGKEFDFVFNCGGETRYSQEDEVYKARSHALSLTIGKEAAKRHVKYFLELSTGMVYNSKERPRKETDKLEPWLKLARWKLQAEQDLSKIDGLNLCIFRMAHVYGPYTNKYLATALCLARVYQKEQDTMKWLWNKDLRTNTVHVEDVARAMWTSAEWYVKGASKRPPPIFNIVDPGNTCESFAGSVPKRLI
jgi:nucleoside-diphosphate-sugar epimerase